MKAVVLAAGFGTRLRPITDHIPKPLVPILGHPLIGIAISQLQQAGAKNIGVNAHHLSDKISAFLARYHGNTIKLSVETPEILGSGGALVPFKDWIGQGSVLVYNGDILSNIDFANLAYVHESHQNFVTMAVRPGHNGQDRAVWASKKAGVLEVLDISKIRPSSVPTVDPYTFASAYIISPLVFDFLPAHGPADIIQAILEGKQAGLPIQAVVHEGFWADVGTPGALWATTKSVSQMPLTAQTQLLGGNAAITIAKSASIDSSAALSGAVFIGDDSVVGAKAQISEAILLAGAVVAPGEKISQAIIGPGAGGFRVSCAKQ